MSFQLVNRLMLVLAASFFISSCGLPRDQRGTLRRVEGERRVRVGLIENNPWVARIADDEPTGAEVELMRRYAAEFGATPEWIWTNEPDAMEALIKSELDLVAGGLTEETLWADQVALTTAYFTDRLVVGVPPAAQPLKKIEGKNISVESNDLLAATLVAAENATPVRVEKLSPTVEAAAGRDWHLEHSGFNLTDIELQTDKHVIAVAPGENGWLVRLEEFLKRQRPAVKDLLRQQQQLGESR